MCLGMGFKSSHMPTGTTVSSHIYSVVFFLNIFSNTIKIYFPDMLVAKHIYGSIPCLPVDLFGKEMELY